MFWQKGQGLDHISISVSMRDAGLNYQLMNGWINACGLLTSSLLGRNALYHTVIALHYNNIQNIIKICCPVGGEQQCPLEETVSLFETCHC